MITQFELNLNPITIQLPETHIIISKDDYDYLIKEASLGRYMSLTALPITCVIKSILENRS